MFEFLIAFNNFSFAQLKAERLKINFPSIKESLFWISEVNSISSLELISQKNLLFPRDTCRIPPTSDLFSMFFRRYVVFPDPI